MSVSSTSIFELLTSLKFGYVEVLPTCDSGGESGSVFHDTYANSISQSISLPLQLSRCFQCVQLTRRNSITLQKCRHFYRATAIMIFSVVTSGLKQRPPNTKPTRNHKFESPHSCWQQRHHQQILRGRRFGVVVSAVAVQQVRLYV